MSDNNSTHELDAHGADDYPETLCITVGARGDVFDQARDHLTSDGVTSEAIRSFDRLADVRKLLTDRRVEVMRVIMTDTPTSISDLADRLDRNYADVHDDVHVLADHHIIYFRTDGRAKCPVIPYERVHLDVEVVGGANPDHAVA